MSFGPAWLNRTRRSGSRTRTVCSSRPFTAVNRRVRPDAECKRQEDDERPGLGAEQDADGEAQVLDESGHGSPFE
jgi:hypothetical protein